MTRARTVELLLCLHCLLAPACTFDAGHGFATIEQARLAAFLEPGAARDLDGGVVLTDLGYHVAVEELAVGVASVELLELGGGASSVTFDPASPPPGYTLCHGGHCHADDGSLVSYEDVQAELAGGTASFSTLATLAADAELDLLAGEELELTDISPWAELPSGTISRVELGLTSLHLSAIVTAGSGEHDLGAEAVTLSADLDLSSAAAIAVTASRPLDRDHEEEIDLLVDLVADGTLFDGLAVSSLAADRAFVIDDVESEAALTLVGSLRESELVVSF